MRLEIRSVQDRERNLTMHEIHVNDIGPDALAKCLELPHRLSRINQGGGNAYLLSKGSRAIVVLRGNKKIFILARNIVRSLHRKIMDFMTKGF